MRLGVRRCLQPVVYNDVSLNVPSPQAGMIIDNGVKTTQASAKDKRPFLSIISAR